jgi:iron complex transport system ATP-binding protein
MNDIVLSIKDLNFSYDGSNRNIISEFNLDVNSGSFISILGPNGSGKSTLVNLISKVLKGYTGRIEVFGMDIKKMEPREIAKYVAVVPQFTNPAFDFSVMEMVMMGRYPHISRFGSEGHKDFEVVEKVMEETKVGTLVRKKFNELSGGEKQRVVIAQALVQDSPIILLDEPTSHLDINYQIELMDLFYRLNLNGKKTILGVFHDINLAASFTRSILFLKNGRLYASGAVNETITRENIKNVFGSDVYVGKNPITGKIYVSPIFFGHDEAPAAEDIKATGIATKIHVIGGGGEAAPLLKMLYGSGYNVTCGVVNNFDNDLDTAQSLGIVYVSEAPFSPISLYSQNKNMDLIRKSDVVILPPVAFGHGNFSNLISVKEAIEMGKKVIVIDKGKIEDRDYTDGKATKLYGRIMQMGVTTVNDISKISNFL